MGAFRITTSWDDGHHLDVRLADLLHAHGLTGTFYLCAEHSAFGSWDVSLARDLLARSVEVGSHGLTHQRLPTIRASDSRREIFDSRTRIQDALGVAVDSFCYPYGAFGSRETKLVAAAGYRLGRTCIPFRSGICHDPFRMPVTIHCAPRRFHNHVSTALKMGNVRGFLTWAVTLRMRTKLVSLVTAACSHAKAIGGTLHLWGHSWEIDAAGMWDELDDALAVVAAAGGQAVTNRQLLDP